MPVSGVLVEYDSILDEYCISDLVVGVGCATLPCKPYTGAVCKEGTDPTTSGWIRWIGDDEDACIPNGWVACPEIGAKWCGPVATTGTSTSTSTGGASTSGTSGG